MKIKMEMMVIEEDIDGGGGDGGGGGSGCVSRAKLFSVRRSFFLFFIPRRKVARRLMSAWLASRLGEGRTGPTEQPRNRLPRRTEKVEASTRASLHLPNLPIYNVFRLPCLRPSSLSLSRVFPPPCSPFLSSPLLYSTLSSLLPASPATHADELGSE